MNCPKCGAPMEHSKGENEALDGRLYPYASWFCAPCSHFINDYEDEFEFPTEEPKS